MADRLMLPTQDQLEMLSPRKEILAPAFLAGGLLIESGYVATLVSMQGASRTCVGLLGEGSLIGARENEDGLRWSYFTLSDVAVRPIRPGAEPLSSAQLQAQHAQCVSQLALVAMCNARHNLAQRCAQWLMRFSHHLGSTIQITHEFLAEIIGVRRSGISTVLHTWQQEGLIMQRHGQITVADQEGLRRRACSCPMIEANADPAVSAALFQGEILQPPSGLALLDKARPVSDITAVRQLSIEFAQERARFLTLQQTTHALVHGMREKMNAMQGELQSTSLGLQRAQSVSVTT
jgi:hypothetical protein